jgi:hypothetical protein
MYSSRKLFFYKRKIFPPPSSFPKYPKKLKWLVLGCSTLFQARKGHEVTLILLLEQSTVVFGTLFGVNSVCRGYYIR